MLMKDDADPGLVVGDPVSEKDSQRVSIDGRALFRDDDRAEAGERKSVFGLETDDSMIYNSLWTGPFACA